jgi:hypothetical protein
MPLFKRFDGDLAKDISPTRAIMPYLMQTRGSASVYFEQNLDVTRAYAFMADHKKKTGERLTFFSLFSYAAVRTLHERPRLNRFTMGRSVYQRKKIEIAFSAKKAMSDDAPVVVVKRAFEPNATFEEHVQKLSGGVSEGRSKEKSATDKELSLFLSMPGFLLAMFVALAKWLDAHNLLPRMLIEGDPLYASVFVANLGSVGLDAAYHHLYEWGNCPIFAAVGRVRDEEKNGVVKKVCTVRYTFDERIEDGLYCARALEHLRTIIETWDVGAEKEAAPELAMAPALRRAAEGAYAGEA